LFFNGRKRGLADGEELSQDRQEVPPEDHGEGQTLPLRHVQEAKPETRQDSGSLVLPDLREPD
jgi:hypothetical protein